MTLGDVILKDIKNVFSSSNIAKAYDDIAAVYQRSIEKSNAASLNPDGSERVSLSDSAPFFYRTNKAERVGSDKPDLMYSGKAKNSLTFDDKNDGFSMYHSDPEADYYMAQHEFGRGGMPAGGNQRRQFPTAEDSKTPHQTDNINSAKMIILGHLNKPRTVVFNG